MENNSSQTQSAPSKGKKLIPIILIVLLALGLIGLYFFDSATIDSTNNSKSASNSSETENQIVKEQDLSMLQNKIWQWVKTENNGEVTVYDDYINYTIVFNEDFTFGAQADCNSVRGSYEASNPVYSEDFGYYFGSIRFLEPFATTLAFCGENSRESTMLSMFSAVQDYRIYSNGKTLALVWPAAGPVEYFEVAENMEEGSNDSMGSDPLNTTYIIQGQEVTLTNGASSEPAAPGSASTIDTTVWSDNYPTGDLTANGKTDAAVILVQNTGGSGEFFYVAASLTTDVGTLGTNAVLLGDRIAMQNYSINDGIILVNYAVQAEDAAMSDTPSEAMSKWFKVESGILIEVTPSQI